MIPTGITHPHKITVALLSAMLFLLVSLGTVTGGLLCLSPKGHKPIQHQVQESIVKCDTHCLDLVISAQNPEAYAQQGHDPLKIQAMLPMIEQSAQPINLLWVALETIFPQPPPLKPPLQQFLNTVRLLI